MSSLQQLVKCPTCNCLVRSDRLEKHIRKVHHDREVSLKIDNSIKVVSDTSSSLILKKFKRARILVNSWLRRRKTHLYNSNNVEILTIMALQIFMGYDSNEIRKLYNGYINDENWYVIGTRRLKSTYEQMIDELRERLIPYSKNSNYEEVHEFLDSEDNESNIYIRRHNSNSLNSMDGSKYIGYYRREYENSRFGSFPAHDDYGEESWANGIY